MLRMESAKRILLSAAFAVAILLLPVRAFASILDYTFSGVGTGAITGTHPATFTNTAFTVTFVEDTTNIVPLSPGFNYFPLISGTFTEGGYTTTFTNDYLEVNGNGNTGSGNFQTVFLFNSTFGTSIGITSNPALLGYALATPVTTGVVTGPNIGAFTDATGFTTNSGDVVDITGLSSLDFTVTNPSAVPEPSTLLLLTTGLSGIGMLRRRFNS
jgi:PEP-CTERM motif